MAEVDRSILIQCVIIQRDQVPSGWRVLIDGRYERTSVDNAAPTATELLDRDRALNWQSAGILSIDQVQAIQLAIRESGFFNLQPRLLINYCKEDPGVAIWHVSIGDEQARVVVYDPKPKRSVELDKLRTMLNQYVAV